MLVPASLAILGWLAIFYFSDRPCYLCIVTLGISFSSCSAAWIFRLSHNVVSFSAAITSCEAGRGSQITFEALRGWVWLERLRPSVLGSDTQRWDVSRIQLATWVPKVNGGEVPLRCFKGCGKPAWGVQKDVARCRCSCRMIVHISSHPANSRPNAFSYQAALSSTRENWRQVGGSCNQKTMTVWRLHAVWLFVSCVCYKLWLDSYDSWFWYDLNWFDFMICHLQSDWCDLRHLESSWFCWVLWVD